MPAPPLSNTLDQGVDGVDVATSDPGSPNSFGLVTAIPPKYTNVQAHSAPLSMRWVTLTSSHWVSFLGLGSLTGNVYIRFYLFLPSLPSDNNFYPIAWRTNTDGSSAILRILTGGTIQGRTPGNSSAFCDGSVPIATGQWVRIEVRYLANVDPAIGQMEWRLYNTADSTTPSETQISPLNAAIVYGANTDKINFGMTTTAVAAGLTFYIDDIAVSTTGWIGPYVSLPLDATRPDADVTTTGWTTTPLFSKVNDSSDATVIQATAV